MKSHRPTIDRTSVAMFFVWSVLLIAGAAYAAALLVHC